MDYAERCLKKAEYLLDEVLTEKEPHYYKQIVAIWEILEQLLRALLFCKRKIVYERPQKIIASIPRYFPELKNPRFLANLQKAYNMRKLVVHKPRVPNKDDLHRIIKNFCFVIVPILNSLERLGQKTIIKEKIRNLCGNNRIFTNYAGSNS